MTTPVLTCTGCGTTKPEKTGDPSDVFPSAHCGECPPWQCEDCGQMSSAADLCPCWTRLDGMTLADIKAVFAEDGTLNLGGIGPAGSGDQS